MRVTQKVEEIFDGSEGDSPGVKASQARILCTGKLAGAGEVVILPVDQGFEHGPARPFAPNPPAYDPHYHYSPAIEAGLNVYVDPLGMIAQGGENKDLGSVYEEVRDGGANGSIIGRNIMQQPKEEVIEMLGKTCDIYLGKA